MVKLLQVKDLKTYFYTESGIARAVDGVNFSIEPERTLGVVGESGCGKSVTALTIMGLLQMPPAKIEGGEIFFNQNGKITDLAKLDPKGSEMRSIRGNEIAMVFQEPMTSLNPVFTIGNQIQESIILHQNLNKRDSRDTAIEMLRKTGIPEPAQRFNEYPHQLSGGMRQRAMIALALCCNPSLLIADEPTTALDVTIQAQVLNQMKELSKNFKTAILFITHDLGVIAKMAHDVIVMYLGKIVEKSNVNNLFFDPKHPYTKGLMRSIPTLGVKKKERLKPIEGIVPDLFEIPKGCGFNNRCSQRMKICEEQSPTLFETNKDHLVACWLYN